MKYISNYLYLTVFITILLTGCKKYGFNISDGYVQDTLKENITVDTSMKPDYSMIAQARIFPGLVDAEEPRLMNQQVNIDLDYVDEKYNRLRISVMPQPQFTTGYYAAPGEVVVIDVPAHAKGLTAQIGAWTDDLSGKASPKRYPVVFSRQTLIAGQRNYVRNLFGGNVYIRTQFPIKEPVTLVFSNVCKSPDFFFGKTNEAAWKQEIMNSSVPWFEFVTKSVIFTLPTERMKNLLTRNPNFDMTANAKGWEDIVALDYNQWMGLSDTASDERDLQIDLPSRYVLDIEISVGWGHNGYPVMAYDDPEWFNSAMDGNRPVSMWGALHELGHNVQQGSVWSWSGLGETTCNLFSFKRAERMGIPYKNLHSDGWVQEALNYVKTGTAAFDNANLSPFHKLVPFLQIFHKANRYDGKEDGWGFMGFLYRKARHAERLSATDLDKRDFLYEALCEYTGKDYALFFEAWKIPISNYSRDKMELAYPKRIDRDIWNYNPFTKTGGDQVIQRVEYNRSSWTIAELSTEETAGEGANNGRAIHMLDGNLNTFWHSQWYGGTSNYPHFFTIDMQKSNLLTGIYMTQRQANANVRAKDFEVYVGNDLSNMIRVQTDITSLQNIINKQYINFTSPIKGRYIKIILKNGYGPKFAAMAEFGAF